MTPWTSIVPELPVKDLARALDYYENVLGFTVDRTYEGHFANLSRDGVRVFLAEVDWEFTSGACDVYTEDVDRVHTELSERGARILSAPEDKPWGTREFAFEDLDGHLFRVHTRLMDRDRR